MNNRRLILFFLCLSPIIIITGLGHVPSLSGGSQTASAASELKARRIRRLPIERNEPIAIGKVKVKDQSIIRNRTFLADDDWLNDLTIRIKNRAEQRILLATIQLQFPRPLGSEGPIAIADIHYGNSALLTRVPSKSEQSLGIAPEEVVDITCPPAEVNSIGILLDENDYPSIIENIALRISSVVFEDGTMWRAGSRLERNQNDPRKWTNVEFSGLADVDYRRVSLARKSSARNDYKPFRFSSLSPVESLLLRASFDPSLSIQSGCHRFLGTTNEDCGVAGHACTYVKSWVSQDFGGYYLADCSAQCTGTCGWHASKVENPCSGGGGGGNLEDFNNGYGEECFDDSECDAGLYCDWSTDTCSQL